MRPMTDNGKVHIEILKASKEDLEIVWGIVDSCSNWLVEKKEMSHWKDYYTKKIINEKFRHGEIYILYQGNNPVGTVSLSRECPEYYTNNDEKVDYSKSFPDSESPALYISSLAVLPEYQRKGYGRALVKYAEEKSVLQGLKYIRFDVRGDYRSLVNFYEKQGYEIVGDMLDPDGIYLLFQKKVIWRNKVDNYL